MHAFKIIVTIRRQMYASNAWLLSLSLIVYSILSYKRFDTRSGNILSFLLPLFSEGQLSVTGENMRTKYWLTA